MNKGITVQHPSTTPDKHYGSQSRVLSLSCFFSSLVHIHAYYIYTFPLESICFETLTTFIGIVSLFREETLHLSPLQLFDKCFSVFREFMGLRGML